MLRLPIVGDNGADDDDSDTDNRGNIMTAVTPSWLAGCALWLL